MRLKKVSIHNFRGYTQKITIPIDKCLTGFAGKNDVGKSSILEAIGIFLNSDSVSLDKEDFCVSNPNCLIEITCVFDNIPEEVIIDEANPTTLSDEYLLNERSELEIKKVYKKTKLKEPVITIHAMHPTTDGYNDIHKLDLKGLKTKAKEIGVDEKTIEDKRRSAL